MQNIIWETFIYKENDVEMIPELFTHHFYVNPEYHRMTYFVTNLF